MGNELIPGKQFWVELLYDVPGYGKKGSRFCMWRITSYMGNGSYTNSFTNHDWAVPYWMVKVVPGQYPDEYNKNTNNEQLICPVCGSNKTYKTDAIHCSRCAVTTEI